MTISSIQSLNYQDVYSHSKQQTRSSAESVPTQSIADTVSFSPQARAMLDGKQAKKEMTPEEFQAATFKDRDIAQAEEVPMKVTLLSMLMDALLLAQLAENGDSIVPAPSDAQNTQENGSNEQGSTSQATSAQTPVKETAEAAKSKPSAMLGNSGKVSEIKQIIYNTAGGVVDISDLSRAMGSASTPPSAVGSEGGGAERPGKSATKNDLESTRLLVT